MACYSGVVGRVLKLVAVPKRWGIFASWMDGFTVAPCLAREWRGGGGAGGGRGGEKLFDLMPPFSTDGENFDYLKL